MGAAMVRRLAGAGHTVGIWNRSGAAATQLAAQVNQELTSPGRPVLITTYGTAAEAVSGADVVLSMLADGKATTSVLLDRAVLAALRPGAIVCDLATSGVAAATRLATQLSAAGVTFVDAPVSGSVPSVLSGQLLVMASGSPDAIAAVTPLLSAFAKKVARVGDAGAGQSMKLAVNLVVHDLNAALSEALTLASRAGIDPAAAYDVFVDSAVAAPFVAYKREAFLTDGVPVAMSLDLVAKDLRLICELASELEVEVAATTAVRDQVAAARDAGFGAQDMASLQRYLAQLRPGAAAAPPPA
jgi:3-hydroxyisobutyrate dehydrogenase-like beta-hydroxyacid dehydrogenase